jgi:hypothetical protein
VVRDHWLHGESVREGGRKGDSGTETSEKSNDRGIGTERDIRLGAGRSAEPFTTTACLLCHVRHEWYMANAS